MISSLGNSILNKVWSACLTATVLMLCAANVDADEVDLLPGQRVVLVTGSTGGLGRETARALASSGDHVIIHGRNEDRGKALVDEILQEGKGSARFYKADFGNLEEIRNLARSILTDYERLDVLVNNAGIFGPERNQRLVSEDGYELHFQVNYLAGYVLTEMLAPLLESSAPSRVINVASGQAALDFDNLMLETEYSGAQAYFQSKLAQIMMTFALADELSARGVTINAMHPSDLMNTDMVLEAGMEPLSSVETGRDALLRLVNEEVGTGKFFNVFDEDDVHSQAYDDEAVTRLMQITSELVAEKNDELRKIILAQDKELFDGYNSCDLEQWNSYLAEEIEFYQDNDDVTTTRAELEPFFKDRCGTNHVQTLRRELVAETVEVHPIQGFGAVQFGTHRFWVVEKGQADQLVATPKFVHLWQLQDGAWKITQVISYGH